MTQALLGLPAKQASNVVLHTMTDLLRNFKCRRFRKVIRTLRFTGLDKDAATIQVLILIAVKTLDPPPPIEILEEIVANTNGDNWIDNDSSMSSKTTQQNYWLIHTACRTLRVSQELLLWLVQKKTNPGQYLTQQKSPHHDGLTPLQIILRFRPHPYLRIILPLLDDSADTIGAISSTSFLWLKDSEGRLPIHYWAQYGNKACLETARMLIPAAIYADPKLRGDFLMQRDDENGNTPLHTLLLCRSQQQQQQQHEEDVCSKPIDTSCLLELIPSNVEAQKKLLQLPNNRQQTPLDLALLRQPPASAEQLRMLMVLPDGMHDNDDKDHLIDGAYLHRRHPANRRHAKTRLLPIEVLFRRLRSIRHSSSRCGKPYQDPRCSCILQTPDAAVWKMLMPRNRELRRDFFLQQRPVKHLRVHHTSRFTATEYLIIQGYQFEQLYAPGGNLLHAVLGSTGLSDSQKHVYWRDSVDSFEASVFSQSDSLGRLPLHLAMRLPHSTAWNMWQVFSQKCDKTLKERTALLQSQLWTPDWSGRLPLHIALNAGSLFYFVRTARWYDGATTAVLPGVIAGMIDLSPAMVTAVDAVTGFYPFLLSAVAAKGTCGSGADSEGTSEKQQALDNSLQLSTIYELLRRAPEVIGHIT